MHAWFFSPSSADKIWDTVPGIRNPRCGIQNPRHLLSLHRSNTSVMRINGNNVCHETRNETGQSEIAMLALGWISLAGRRAKNKAYSV